MSERECKMMDCPYTYQMEARNSEYVRRIAALEAENARLKRLIDDPNEGLFEAVAYTLGRLEPDRGGCPERSNMAEELRKLANERAAWIEVAVASNVAISEFLAAHGIPEPYGMPVDGVSQLLRATKAKAEGE